MTFIFFTGMKRMFNYLGKFSLFIFLLANAMSAMHAYKFTHYKKGARLIAKSPEALSMNQKINALIFGVSLPRPIEKEKPDKAYKTILINNELSCWQLDVPNTKGMVILFHGYGSEKSSVTGRASEFNRMGYSTLLVDFKGSGGSAGSTTTIGFQEAEQVKTCYDYIQQQYHCKIILCGTSMGAAAVMKCVHDTKIKPEALILECPFGSMLHTVENRFNAMGVPAFPMAHLLVFYGGVLNGFWAFDHNPIDYAKEINTPALLLCGGCDERVTQQEIDDIYNNLKGRKRKVIYPLARHESYLNHYREEWRDDVTCFLEP